MSTTILRIQHKQQVNVLTPMIACAVPSCHRFVKGEDGMPLISTPTDNPAKMASYPRKSRYFVMVFMSALMASGVGLTVITFFPTTLDLVSAPLMWRIGILVALAFFCEYVDSSLGMGYGTLLAPLLVLLEFDLMAIVPAILLSEALTGVCAGAFHHRHGNVDWRHDVHARRTLASLGGCSLVGAGLAVAFAINIPKDTVNLYIALMIVAIAAYLAMHARRPATVVPPTTAIESGGSGSHPPSLVDGANSGTTDSDDSSPSSPAHPARGRIVALGLVAAFNKGVSGGGYGPLLTGGQMLTGVPERTAVAVTSLAESGVCVLGFVLYVAARGTPDWTVTIPLCSGALLSVPLATWTVKELPVAFLRRAMVGAMLYLGLLMLAKTCLAG